MGQEKRHSRVGRAAGPDGIPPELLKYAIGPVPRALHSLFCQVWSSGLDPPSIGET